MADKLLVALDPLQNKIMVPSSVHKIKMLLHHVLCTFSPEFVCVQFCIFVLVNTLFFITVIVFLVKKNK